MSSSTLIEVFGHILFSFTRGVTEHYNPQEPEYTAESFGYSPLESTGPEWYHHGDPEEECIYQEYSDREATTLEFIRSSRINASLIDPSLPEENEETQEDQIEQSWLGSDSDHPLSERSVNQCTLELSFRHYLPPL